VNSTNDILDPDERIFLDLREIKCMLVRAGVRGSLNVNLALKKHGLLTYDNKRPNGVKYQPSEKGTFLCIATRIRKGPRKGFYRDIRWNFNMIADILKNDKYSSH